MRWPLGAWERIMGIALINRWSSRNVINALVSFTILAFIIALARIVQDWVFIQTDRLILTIAAFLVMGLSFVTGIGLATIPGDSLNLGIVRDSSESSQQA